MSVNIPALTCRSQPVSLLQKRNTMRSAQSVMQYFHRTFTVSPIYTGHLSTGYVTLALHREALLVVCCVVIQLQISFCGAERNLHWDPRKITCVYVYTHRHNHVSSSLLSCIPHEPDSTTQFCNPDGWHARKGHYSTTKYASAASRLALSATVPGI